MVMPWASIGPGTTVPSPAAVDSRHRSVPSLVLSAIVSPLPVSLRSSRSSRSSETPTTVRYASSGEQVDHASAPDDQVERAGRRILAGRAQLGGRVVLNLNGAAGFRRRTGGRHAAGRRTGGRHSAGRHLGHSRGQCGCWRDGTRGAERHRAVLARAGAEHQRERRTAPLCGRSSSSVCFASRSSLVTLSADGIPAVLRSPRRRTARSGP